MFARARARMAASGLRSGEMFMTRCESVQVCASVYEKSGPFCEPRFFRKQTWQAALCLVEKPRGGGLPVDAGGSARGGGVLPSVRRRRSARGLVLAASSNARVSRSCVSDGCSPQMRIFSCEIPYETWCKICCH